jgi:hypothetical protein
MKKIFIYTLLASSLMSSCTYLDVVPDNVATLDYAFRTRNSARKYLATCYSKLPNFYDPFAGNIGLVGSDELIVNDNNIAANASIIQLGQQTKNDILVDYWSGRGGGINMWQGIRDCNIFLENIDNVVELTFAEKENWKGEVKFLKAFYHFYLLKSYGAIPIVDVNEPINITPEEVQAITRDPADKVFEYIVKQLDEAIELLPDQVISPAEELGRITKPIAMAMKGKVLLYHASPLFNGNADYPNFRNSRNENLINATYDATRWEKAANALEEAINYAHDLGHQLHYFQPGSGASLSAQTLKELDLRTSVTGRWNSEVIWGDPTNGGNNTSSNRLQLGSLPKFDINGVMHGVSSSYLGVSLNHVEKFYTENGVPVDEDTDPQFENLYGTPKAKSGNNYYTHYLAANRVTSPMNHSREPRFYAYLAFDGNLYYGQDALSDAARKELKLEIFHGNIARTTSTGYNPKKMVSYLSTITGTTDLNQYRYPFPVIRLADLYLMYAEAANEAFGPSNDIYNYLNMIRERAGLKTIQSSWQQHSRYPDKYLSQDGLREIIRRERTIELSFEGSRFWDLRRWKTAHFELNQQLKGWYIGGYGSASTYYNAITLYSQKFDLKNYFWPIREDELIKSPNIKQSPGW